MARRHRRARPARTAPGGNRHARDRSPAPAGAGRPRHGSGERKALAADLTLKEFPGRRFEGTLVRTAQSIDVSSRTLLTEIDVDNPKGELLPGSYAEVHLKLPTPASTLKLPVSALIFRADGLMVATIRNGNQVAIVPVTAGRDYGNAVEIVGGLTGSERIVVNPSD